MSALLAIRRTRCPPLLVRRRSREINLLATKRVENDEAYSEEIEEALGPAGLNFLVAVRLPRGRPSPRCAAHPETAVPIVFGNGTRHFPSPKMRWPRFRAFRRKEPIVEPYMTYAAPKRRTQQEQQLRISRLSVENPRALTHQMKLRLQLERSLRKCF